MTETIKVKILEDGVTATEINPIKMPDAFFEGRKKEWNEAEAKLRTFDIDFIYTELHLTQATPIGTSVRRKMENYLKSKDKFDAEILDNGKIKIL